MNVVRSRPRNTTVMFMSLIIDGVDPPQTRGRYPVMSPALELAFSKIEKGAKERLEALRSKKECMEVSTEMVPRLIGHVEKVEKEDVDKEGEQIEGGAPAAEKEVSGGLTADREVTVTERDQGKQTIEHMDTDKSAKPTDSSGRRTRPSISRMKEERK